MKHLKLTSSEEKYLKVFTRSGTRNVQEINRVYFLLLLHKGKKMAEIEINIMETECPGKKIGIEEVLKQRLHAWTTQRNSERKKIIWTFTKQEADQKSSKHYVV